MRTVFISYSRNNLDVVSQLVRDLQDVGFSAWHDQTLTGGQRWWDNILANIRNCDVFIFALSKESWESEACQSELGYVVEIGKPILPVQVSDNIHLGLLSAPLSEIQVTDYRRRDKAAAFSLLRAINATPVAPPLPDPLPSAPPVPVSYLGTLKERIDSPGPLAGQEQNLLFLEIEAAIEKGRSRAEIRDLLNSLKQRNDLLASVGKKVDEALRTLGGHVPPPAPPAWPVPTPNPGLPAPRVSNCSKCQEHIEPDWRFCRTCGNPLPADNNAGKMEGSTSRRYACSADDISRLISDVRGWLNSQDFDTQEMKTAAETVLLQIKKRGNWRDFFGMATSLNIMFHQGDDTLTVEIGAGKWVDKAAAGAVGIFLLPPLAITAGIGAWEQTQMPEKIFNYIGARLTHR
jgi:hypothetical protein